MKSLRPITRSIPRIRPSPQINAPTLIQTRIQQQTFISSPFSSDPQTITASRTLPYPQRAIFDVIADVSAYHTYLPYCRASTVTKTSQPTQADGKSYAEEAQLSIGFADGVSEDFHSRVYCVPHEIVEAVSGATNTSLSADSISHHSSRSGDAESDPTRKNTVLTHLLTRWTLRPFMYKPPPASAAHPSTAHKNHDETSPVPGREKTDVSLHIEFQFANPVYAALSQAAAPKVAEKMIEAFEKRVREVVEGPGSVRSAGR